jgi:glyoxylase-like metal-dependent hydrolase (beta-lactamase superfamily II)
MDVPTYEVLALRYATHQNRSARANFIAIDAHDSPMPLDYFVWVIRGPIGAASQRTIVVDTGMNDLAAARRPGRVILTPVEEMLRRVGVDPGVVRDVVLTHMHFDHAGCIDLFPTATFHIQDSEMAFCTGRCMCHRVLRDMFEVDHVIAAVRRVHDGRMSFHDGTAEIAPGITLHLIGGHSGGLQVVRVPRAVAGLSSPQMQHISGRTYARAVRFQLWWIWLECWRATKSLNRSRTGQTTLSPAMIR